MIHYYKISIHKMTCYWQKLMVGNAGKIIAAMLNIFILAGATAQTPDLEIDTQASGPITVCGNPITFTVSIRNTSGQAIQNVKLYPQMPPGILYVATSATGMTEASPFDINNPSFIINDFSVDQERTVTFQGKADCRLITYLQFSGASNLVNNETKINYTINGVSKEAVESEAESYSVLYPQLELLVPGSEKNLAVGLINVVVNRHITIRNSGLGQLTTVDFYLKTGPELAVDKLEMEKPSGNLVLTPAGPGTLGTKYTITNFTGIGDGDAFFEEGESIVLIDFVKAVTSKAAIQTVYTVQWGCGGEICNTGDPSATFTAYIQAIGGKPSIEESHTVTSQTDFCNDVPAVIKFGYTNVGYGNSPASRDAAFHVKWRYTETTFANGGSHSFYIQRADNSLVNVDHLLTYSESSHTLPGITRYTGTFEINLDNAFTTDVDGAGGLDDIDQDGFFDDLLPGNTLYIVAHTKPTLTGDVVTFTNAAKNFYYGNLQYKTWSGFSETHRAIPRNFYTVRHNKHELQGPSDLINGSIETFRFNVSTTSLSSIIHFNDATFELDIRVPQGVTVRSVRYAGQPLTYTQNGDRVQVIHPLSSPAPLGNAFFDIECETNCSINGLNEKVKADLYHYSDYACSGGRFKLASVEKEVFMHCATCNTIGTTQFTVERSTLGWAGNAKGFYTYENLYGASALPRVTPSTPGIRLDAAYPRDEVKIVVKGRNASVSTTYNNVSAEVAYTSELTVEALEYTSATFVVNGTEYQLPAGFHPIKSVTGNTHNYLFNIPLGGSLPSQLTAGTSFELRAYFKVSDLTAVDRGEFPLVRFRGRFFGTLGPGAQTICPGLGDSFTVLKPSISFRTAASASYQLTGEGKVLIGSFYTEQGNLSDDKLPDFPNEFRPLYYLNNYTVTLPKGFIFDVERINTSPNSFTFSPDRRTIILPLSNNTVVSNEHNWNLYAYVKLDCTNPDNLFEPVNTSFDIRNHKGTYTFKEYAYLPATSQHLLSPAGEHTLGMINNRRPNIQLTANTEQEGYSDIVTWPVQLCNPFGNYFSDTQNTWVAVELKEDDNSTMLQGAVDENGAPMEVVFYDAIGGGKNMLVKLGQLNLTTCKVIKVVARYKNCREGERQELDVFASWDFNSYPNVTGYSGSVTSRMPSCESFLFTETMAIKYKTAALQWKVTKVTPGDTDLCVPVPFEIDLTSTRYADMSNLKLWIELPPYAALDTNDPPKYYYPDTETPAVIPAGAFITEGTKQGWDISTLVGGNLPGTRLETNKIKLAFNIITSCGFDQGIPVRYTVSGYTNCNDLVEFVDQRKIRLQGFELDSLSLKLSAIQTPRCNFSNDLALMIKNVGDQSSGLNQLEVTLPSGVDFEQMLQGTLPAPAVTTENNEVKLRWLLPEGYLVAGQSKIVSFRTFLRETEPGTTAIRYSAKTTQSGDAYCSESNSSCASSGTSGSTELSLPVSGFPSLHISHRKYLCTYQFKIIRGVSLSCSVLGYNWDFGDGTSSIEETPFHSFENPGTYTVTLNLSFQCGDCYGVQTAQVQIVEDGNNSEVVLKDTLIQVLSENKNKVLQVSVATFADVWPLDYFNEGLSDRSGFRSGTEGVWRNEGNYVYNVPRQHSGETNIAEDGAFSLQHFNWQHAELDAVPNWIKTNTMTMYSPFSYELENRDVLGVYSAALYDYGGHLPSANGVNMRNREMAFTGFEFLDSTATGNWIFGTNPIPRYTYYTIRSATGNIALVEASVYDLENVERVDVKGRLLVGLARKLKYVTNNEILCRQEYSEFAGWSFIVLKRGLFNPPWRGEIRVRNKIIPVVTPDIDSTFAHTGRSSLRITTQRTFEQRLIQLDSAKSYMISAWVSVNNPNVTVPKLADNLGIDVVFKDKDGNTISTTSFAPSGKIIEGWQQVKGVFVCPASNAIVELKFRQGSTGTAWYDDLRLHPEDGNMKSYVYDLKDYRLRAVLDEENFASLYHYDQEGNLYLVEKETEDGIKTISENVSYHVER